MNGQSVLMRSCFMKKEIHPKYYRDAEVRCACGANLKIGSSHKEMKVDVCSTCHPFYSGEYRILDMEGRVEKFNKRFNIKK